MTFGRPWCDLRVMFQAELQKWEAAAGLRNMEAAAEGHDYGEGSSGEGEWSRELLFRCFFHLARLF